MRHLIVDSLVSTERGYPSVRLYLWTKYLEHSQLFVRLRHFQRFINLKNINQITEKDGKQNTGLIVGEGCSRSHVIGVGLTEEAATCVVSIFLRY